MLIFSKIENNTRKCEQYIKFLKNTLDVFSMYFRVLIHDENQNLGQISDQIHGQQII